MPLSFQSKLVENLNVFHEHIIKMILNDLKLLVLFIHIFFFLNEVQKNLKTGGALFKCVAIGAFSQCFSILKSRS